MPFTIRRSRPAVVRAFALFSLLASGALASDQVPAKPQEAPILLTGGDIHTITGDVIRGGQILLDKGKIVAVGKSVESPSDARRIDVSGKRVYPGLFAAGNDLGLVEIRSVPGSVDFSETGTVNPNARAEVAVNPDSEHVPVARANGVLLNLTVPVGGLLTGTSAVLQLDGWTWEDMTVKAPAGFHLTWPSAGSGRSRRSGAGAAEATSPRDDQFKALDQAFADARAYAVARKAAEGEEKAAPSGSRRAPEFDARWESMIPLLDGRVPLIVRADDLRQIQAAVAFAAREKVKLILFGGYDAPLCAELLKKHDVAVIVNGVQRLPLRNDAPYDEPFTVPARLKAAGVRFCISQYSRHGASDVRNLPYHAATAAAHGLSPEEAIKAITLYPAQILGLADRVGSLEAGRDATLIVTDGDILETPTKVERAFVQGREIDLTSRHTQLWNKYREKYRRQGDDKALAKDE